MDKALQDKLRDEAEHTNDTKPISGGFALISLVVLLAVAGLVAIVGIIPRLQDRKALAAETRTLAAAEVITLPPQSGLPVQDVVLPGNIYAYTDSPIYSRTDGYLEKWYFDIGAHVRKGQLLATVSTPEIDQQLLQARADLTTSQTNAHIASLTANRYSDLLKDDAVSKQDTENFASQAASTGSAVNSVQANVQRLEKLQAFEQIYAPFDGIITARNVDIGQLITSGSNGGAAFQLFHMAAVQMLRVYVAVPQAYGDAAKPGMVANLTFNEYPGKNFPAKVVRSSGYIDPASRTLLVELEYNNHADLLTPGAYTQVHFHLKSAVPTRTIPTSALMFRAEGLRVATVVNASNGATVAKLVPIIPGDDDGKIIQIVSGLDGNSQVIQNPPDSVVDGEVVNVLRPQTSGASPSGAK
jgi:RND family efflux transporter MFP subunit